MFDNSYPSIAKVRISEDVTYLPTAEKSQYRFDTEPYIERTPKRYDYGSPKSIKSPVSMTRKSIDECLYLAS